MSFFVALTDMFRLRNKLIGDCERVAVLCPDTSVDLSEPIWVELSSVAEALQQTNSNLHVFVAVHRERATKLYDLCKRTYWTLVSRTSLIEQFAAHAHATSTARRIINLSHFPIIGDTPNDAPLSELTQIPSIADFSDLMCVRANAFILCRAITAAASSCGLVFVAEDRLGNTFRVHAFYCATLKPEWAAIKAHCGLVVAIKNPALTLCGSSWEPTLRCGHESNFVPIFDISDPLLADTPWFVAPCKSSFDWNDRGNDHFTKREFRSAIAAYTRGLALDGGKNVDLLANRANALLNLGQWRAALDDTNAVLALEGAHHKCVMRRALALCGLRRYREAMDDWMNAAVICRDLPMIKHECIVGAAEAMMLHRQAAGQFDWSNVAKHVLAKGSSRVTTYVNPKVRVSATTIARRQFGVFAREAIARGTLLLVEPPLAVTPAESTDKSGLLRFVDDVILQCERDETKMAQVMELCGASHIVDTNVPRDDGTFGSLVKLMCKSNSTQFHMTWNSTSASDVCLGLFPEVARFNHSCDPNCSLVIIGNFAIIQTVEDIAADQELFVAQIARTMHLPRERRSAILASRQFECNCKRCVFESTDPTCLQFSKELFQIELDIVERLQVMHTRAEFVALGRMVDANPQLHHYVSSWLLHVLDMSVSNITGPANDDPYNRFAVNFDPNMANPVDRALCLSLALEHVQKRRFDAALEWLSVGLPRPFAVAMVEGMRESMESAAKARDAELMRMMEQMVAANKSKSKMSKSKTSVSGSSSSQK